MKDKYTSGVSMNIQWKEVPEIGRTLAEGV
jgi:hypothetical protein